MEYRIIGNKDLRDLELDVNRLIKAGWAPQGGICATYEGSVYNKGFYQAMIRNK